MKLNKFQKSKIIISVLYNLDHVCTSGNKLQWQEAKALSRSKVDHLESRYTKACTILSDKGLLEDWLNQAVTGEQI